jgi:hypothetical protein
LRSDTTASAGSSQAKRAPEIRLAGLPGWQARRMISDETIRDLLHQAWGLADGTRVARHDGGVGS